MHTYQHNPTMASGGSGSGHERAPVISDEDAHRMLGPFVMMGLLKPSQIDAALKRPLRERETALQVLMGQGLQLRQDQRKICAECGKKSGEDGKLKTCSKCNNIWYCSRECQVTNWKSVHNKNCAALKVARVCRETEGERMEVQPEFELAYYKGLQGQSIMQWPAKHVPSTWPEFFQVRGIIMDNTADALGVYNLVVSALLHEGLTCALAAKRFGLLGDHAPAKERAFRLHMLGATDTEEVRRLPLSMGELGKLLVPHYYKGGLEVVLFGPQLANTTPFPVPLDEAIAPGVTVLRRRGYYHDWVAEQPATSAEEEAQWAPDLVVAFNSGAHTGDSHFEADGSCWTPTLRMLEAKGWPVVLTCYDHNEGERTRKTLRNEPPCDADAPPFLNCRIAFGPELNPMRSLVLEEAEPPEAQRWGELMSLQGGLQLSEAEREAKIAAAPLDLGPCNLTAGNSRVWLGFRGRASEAGGEEGQGKKMER